MRCIISEANFRYEHFFTDDLQVMREHIWVFVPFLYRCPIPLSWAKSWLCTNNSMVLEVWKVL